MILIVCNNQYYEEEHAVFNTETRELIVVDSNHNSISGMIEGFDFLGVEHVDFNMVSEKKYKDELYGQGNYFCDMEESELKRMILKRYSKLKPKEWHN